MLNKTNSKFWAPHLQDLSPTHMLFEINWNITFAQKCSEKCLRAYIYFFNEIICKFVVKV